MKMATSSNPVVRKALSAQDAEALAELVKLRPWDDPNYKNREKAELERRVRRVFGDKTVGEWRRILKTHGLWKD